MRRMVLLLVLASGCLTQAVVVERFVCCDGWVVDNPAKCEGHGLECTECECPPCETDVKLEYTAEAVQVTTTVPGADPCVRLGCPAGTEYVASSGSDKYHLCACEWAARISAKNLVCYGSRGEAESDGKTPCAICLTAP